MAAASAVRMELLSVAMPAYNEAAVIGEVILEHAAVLNELSATIPNWEIVVVNDGSTDRTEAVLEATRSRVPQLRWISQANQGIFGAVTRAYREARGSHIYSTGSDGQWPAENFRTMLPALLGGADLVIGVRQNRREVYGTGRRIISHGFNLLPRVVFGVKVGDAGSVKLGRREAFQYELISRSPFFEAERIIRAQREGLKVGFVPIVFQTRTQGKATGASWRNVRGSLRDAARCVAVYGLR